MEEGLDRRRRREVHRSSTSPSAGASRSATAMRRRIAAADEQFKMRRQKGSESARGRLFIVLGNPSRVAAVPAREAAPTATRRRTRACRARSRRRRRGRRRRVQTWIYDKDKFDASWGLGELKIRVAVDPRRGHRRARRTRAARPTRRIATVAVEVDRESQCHRRHAPRPAAPAAAPRRDVPPRRRPRRRRRRALRRRRRRPLRRGRAGGSAMPLPASRQVGPRRAPRRSRVTPSFWSGTFRSPSGDDFLALQFYLPSNKPAFSSGAPLKLGGVVTGRVPARRCSRSGRTRPSRRSRRPAARIAFSTGPSRLPPGTYKGDLRALSGRGSAARGHVDRRLQARTRSRRVRGLAADPLGGPRSPDQAPRARRIRSSSGPRSRSRSSPRATTSSPSRTASGTSTRWPIPASPPTPAAPAPTAAAPAPAAPGSGRAAPAPRGGSEAARHDPHQRAEGRPGRLRAVHRAGRAAADRQPATTAPAPRSRWPPSSPATTPSSSRCAT